MINVLYTGACLGASGYSQSTRDNIAALSTQPDINLSVESLTFETFKTDQSRYDSLLTPLFNKEMKPDIQIIHATPDNYLKYKKPGMLNFGYAAWETSKLPDTWPAYCNSLDALFVPSQWNVDVFKDSGVTIPVYKIPHTVDLEQFKNVEPMRLGIPSNKYVFYSIFQWTERKHPYGLIKAYLSEFTSNDNVALIIKSYRMNHTSQDKLAIEREIQALKAFANSKHLPTVYLIHEALSRDDMLGLHAFGDCMVSPHRGEGFGLTCFESMAMGKPTISTNYSGNLEFMNEENSYLIDYTMTPVSNMPWGIYSIRQDWAEPDIADLKSKMRYVYENQEEAKLKGQAAVISTKEYSWDKIGALFKQTIVEALGGV